MAVAGDRDLEQARSYELPPELEDDDPDDDEDDEVAHLRNSQDSLDEKPSRRRTSRPHSPPNGGLGKGKDDEPVYQYAAGPLTELPSYMTGANGGANGRANGSVSGSADGSKRVPRRREPVKHGKGVLVGGVLALLALAYFFTLFATSGTRYGTR